MLNSDGGLIREGEEFLQFSEDGGMGSPLRPGMPSGKAHLQEVGVHATEDQKQIRTSNTSINQPRSVQMKFYSCLYRL